MEYGNVRFVGPITILGHNEVITYLLTADNTFMDSRHYNNLTLDTFLIITPQR